MPINMLGQKKDPTAAFGWARVRPHNCFHLTMKWRLINPSCCSRIERSLYVRTHVVEGKGRGGEYNVTNIINSRLLTVVTGWFRDFPQPLYIASFVHYYFFFFPIINNKSFNFFKGVCLKILKWKCFLDCYDFFFCSSHIFRPCNCISTFYSRLCFGVHYKIVVLCTVPSVLQIYAPIWLARMNF